MPRDAEYFGSGGWNTGMRWAGRRPGRSLLMPGVGERLPSQENGRIITRCRPTSDRARMAVIDGEIASGSLGEARRRVSR